MSTARAECVSAPTEMKSTPVSAMARTPARFTPPLASVFARPLTFLHRQPQLHQVHVVEQDDVRARVGRLLHLLQRVGFDLDFQFRESCARALNGRGDGIGRLISQARPGGCP